MLPDLFLVKGPGWKADTVSGEPFFDVAVVGRDRESFVKEFVLSATLGEREGVFLTAKKVELGLEPGAEAVSAESISRALMRWEMLLPMPVFLATARFPSALRCCVIWCRYAAPPPLTVLAELSVEGGMRVLRTGLETVRTMCGFAAVPISTGDAEDVRREGKEEVTGVLATNIGWASWTVAEVSSSRRESVGETGREVVVVGRSVTIG